MHPVGEVAVDVEGQGRVADGDMELDLRGERGVQIGTSTPGSQATPPQWHLTI